MNRKAQSQIITTVLIILLVLAAIVIVWQVVQGTVREGAEQIPGQTDCLSLKLDIVEATNDGEAAGKDSITIKREVGTGDLAGFRLFVKDVEKANIDASSLKELEQKVYNLGADHFAMGDNVKIAKIVGSSLANGRLCEFGENSVEGVDAEVAPSS